MITMGEGKSTFKQSQKPCIKKLMAAVLGMGAFVN
jgi:hypothetical protein